MSGSMARSGENKSHEQPFIKNFMQHVEEIERWLEFKIRGNKGRWVHARTRSWSGSKDAALDLQKRLTLLRVSSFKYRASSLPGTTALGHCPAYPYMLGVTAVYPEPSPGYSCSWRFFTWISDRVLPKALRRCSWILKSNTLFLHWCVQAIICMHNRKSARRLMDRFMLQYVTCFKISKPLCCQSVLSVTSRHAQA